MTTLKWKHLEAAVRARIEVLENITQGALLLNLTGVIGDYQMTREESLNSVIVMFCDDEEPAIENVILHDAPDNPVNYTLVSCVTAGDPINFIAGLMSMTPIELQSAAVTKVIYGYNIAFEELVMKLQPKNHGDITVENDNITWKLNPAAVLQETPADPLATVSADGVMMGLSAEITPIRSGRVMITVSGDTDSSVDGGSCQMAIRIGTGVAPVNGAALAGVQHGSAPVHSSDQSTERSPFTCNAVVTGLALNTPVWVDLALAAGGGGASRVRNVSVSAIEL